MTDISNEEEAPLQSEQGEVKQEIKTEDPSDRLTPDHPRFKQVLERAKTAEERTDQLSRELAELKTQINTRRDETNNDELTSDERAAIERIDREFQKRGYVRKDEVNDFIARELGTEKRAQEYRRLTERFDGSNGLPKFIAEDVQEFAKRKGYGDLEEAYFGLHRDAVIDVEAKKRSGNSVPSSEKPTGGDRSTSAPEFTREKIAAMSPEEYEKNAPKIHAWLKAQANG